MKYLSINQDKDKQIFNYIKSVVLREYPISNREEILFTHHSSAMDINFWFFKDEEEEETCEIHFICGSKNYKSSIPDSLDLEGFLSAEVLFDFITFLLNDNRIITSINKGPNSIELNFKVNLSDNAMIGISCDEINITLDFFRFLNCERLLNYYFNLITLKFHDKLKYTAFYKNAFESYSSQIKNSFVDSLDEEELKRFLLLLDKEELKVLLDNISNERFNELYERYSDNNLVLKLENNG